MTLQCRYALVVYVEGSCQSNNNVMRGGGVIDYHPRLIPVSSVRQVTSTRSGDLALPRR